MAAAEMLDESFIRLTDPNFALFGKKVYLVYATSTENTDYITVPQLATVQGCILTATDGTAGTFTIATNVITFTNGSTKTFSGIVWGV